MTDQPKPLTIDELIDKIFAEAYGGCDPALIESNPRAYARAWVEVGFHGGLPVGQKIGLESVDIAMRAAATAAFDSGQTAGLLHAAFIASHAPIDADDPRGSIIAAIKKVATPPDALKQNGKMPA